MKKWSKESLVSMLALFTVFFTLALAAGMYYPVVVFFKLPFDAVYVFIAYIAIITAVVAFSSTISYGVWAKRYYNILDKLLVASLLVASVSFATLFVSFTAQYFVDHVFGTAVASAESAVLAIVFGALTAIGLEGRASNYLIRRDFIVINVVAAYLAILVGLLLLNITIWAPIFIAMFCAIVLVGNMIDEKQNS
jgi:hypothetical protein